MTTTSDSSAAEVMVADYHQKHMLKPIIFMLQVQVITNK